MKKIKRQRCEVYSRIVGYLSPLSQWNLGKKSEWGDRKVFRLHTEKRIVQKQELLKN